MVNMRSKRSETVSRTLARFNVLFSWFGAILLAKIEEDRAGEVDLERSSC